MSTLPKSIVSGNSRPPRGDSAEMNLSEAIRLGSMLKPQTFGSYDSGDGTCALEAAGNAAGVSGRTRGGLDLVERFPVLMDGQLRKCPECGFAAVNFGQVIVHLNDSHRWTRERIADWVETVEAAELTKRQQQSLAALVEEIAAAPPQTGETVQ